MIRFISADDDYMAAVCQRCRVIRQLLSGFCSSLIVICIFAFGNADSAEAAPVSRTLNDPYYPQQPKGELRLNYYYDRTGRWVKFSDWVPFKQKKFVPVFFEDFYSLYGLPPSYKPNDVKESIFYLYASLGSKFKHPHGSLCKIENEDQFHKYRLLMFMETNLLIMRMYLRLGSLYDKRMLYFHDLDVADDLEVSFLIARTYYTEAETYWNYAKQYAEEADQYRFELDIPTIETHRFEIVNNRLDFKRIIDRHLIRIEAKLDTTAAFLDQHGRPRSVKEKMLEDVSKIYDDQFPHEPITKPTLRPHYNEKPLFTDTDQIFAPLNEPLPPFAGR